MDFRVIDKQKKQGATIPVALLRQEIQDFLLQEKIEAKEVGFKKTQFCAHIFVNEKRIDILL